MEMLLSAEGKAAVTDEAMRKVYDDAVKQMGGEQEVRARHILVPTEAEAKAILAEIKKGTDFAELAKQKSKDPGAAARRRRPRLFHQGPDGAGIRRGRVQAGQGPACPIR